MLFNLQNIQDNSKQILSPAGFYFLSITQEMLARRTHPVTAQWFSYTHCAWPLAFFSDTAFKTLICHRNPKKKNQPFFFYFSTFPCCFFFFFSLTFHSPLFYFLALWIIIYFCGWCQFAWLLLCIVIIMSDITKPSGNAAYIHGHVWTA